MLNQYVVLEDKILLGFEFLMETIASPEQKEQLKGYAIKYNELGADYQDQWTEEYWDLYELIREGYKKVKFI